MPIRAQHSVEAAEGWLALGQLDEANQELDRLPDELRSSASVLEMRCRIYAKAERWADVELIAEGAILAHPSKVTFHNYRSWAKYRRGQFDEALKLALATVEIFPESSAAAYCIACLYGAAAKYREAREWISKALERTDDRETLVLRAIHQRELLFLWKESDEMLGPDTV